MTSEILIMTPSAIAMAADSVVTVNDQKTYEGVNKLFMLSNNPPMGVMIYNNANFFNFPMETIIKDFRNNYASQCETVKDFLNSFEKYLDIICQNNQIFCPLIKEEIDLFFDSIQNDINQNNIHLSKIDLNKVNIDLTKYSNKITTLNFDEYFNKKFKNISDDERELTLLKKIFLDTKRKTQFTGVVIAGFNKTDLFPSSVTCRITPVDKSFVIDDIIENSVKESGSILSPFAHIDTITNFLNGIDMSTNYQICSYFDNTINSLFDKLIDVIKESSMISSEKENEFKEIVNEKENLSKNFLDFIEQLKKENYEPIISSLKSLPKEELANLSESLINITSLKLKVQNNLETVGGDVDVAIITKGDGFIWKKRKHYFDKNLNPQYFNRNNY